ncbi:MAG: FKBP-type peptidyl-prolyl cis-trans isomerase [Bacteroidetes bacterium]|nr:FKBP-type peptidyl-prolyl cis-trans isomerase [Bacteroidota bacterium]MBS1757540.1 FKBP-type peptidyl-prolyl cis-trans isomerase [Bacteroidota bacterium]
MKQVGFLLLTLTISLFACKKETAKCIYTSDNIIAPKVETDSIKNYLLANNITNAVQDSSGVFYVITTQGTGPNPTICSNLIVRYRGTYFNNVAFDPTAATTAQTGSSTSTARFDLGGVIEGWKKALPFLKSGGSITLFIPPTLGYGANMYNGIPGNSYLKFTVDLLNVQ